MSNTRRSFLQAGTAVAAGLTGAVSAVGSQAPGPANFQVPQVKFGKAEISRIIVGCDMFYGTSRFNSTYDTVMREWYTPAKVLEVFQRAATNGINAFQALASSRCVADCERFKAEGGTLHYVVQASSDPVRIVKSLNPLGIYHAGKFTGRAFQAVVEGAFRLAFEGIKPADCLFVGMSPRTKGEVKENAEVVRRILKPA
jgi:hypothetical protein